MKTPEEIKKGLECSGKRICIYESCPYYDLDDMYECIENTRADALAYIQQLERERDAAVACIPHACGYCKHFIITHNGCTPDYDCARSGCTNISGVNTGWEWRGVREDA